MSVEFFEFIEFVGFIDTCSHLNFRHFSSL